MSEWFDHINFFLHTHPYWIPKLWFLLRVKCALLSLLMAYFLYRLYSEQPQSEPPPEKVPGRLIA